MTSTFTKSDFLASLNERKSVENEAGSLNDNKQRTFARIEKIVSNDTIAQVFATYNVDMSFIVSRKRKTAMRNIYMVERACELASFLSGNVVLQHYLYNIALTMRNLKNANIECMTMKEARCACSPLKEFEKDISKDHLKLISRYSGKAIAASTLNTQTPISLQSFEVFNILERSVDSNGNDLYRMKDSTANADFFARLDTICSL